MRALMGAIAATDAVELDHVDLLARPPHRRLASAICRKTAVSCRNSRLRRTSGFRVGP
jgi:hypothetical protein